MIVYNFRDEYAGMVERGEKTSTIRAHAKRRPPNVGEHLRLYTGMRTKKCRRLRDTTCQSCVSIRISDKYIAVGGRIISPGEELDLARRDGFLTVAHLRDKFRFMHGPLPFEGWLITWRPS